MSGYVILSLKSFRGVTRGGEGGVRAVRSLADQLILFKPGGGRLCPLKLLPAPPDSKSYLHLCPWSCFSLILATLHKWGALNEHSVLFFKYYSILCLLLILILIINSRYSFSDASQMILLNPFPCYICFAQMGSLK